MNKYINSIYIKMSEPGTVPGAIASVNPQGSYSRTHYTSFVPTGGDAANPMVGRHAGATGFNTGGDAQDVDDAVGDKKDYDNDEIEQSDNQGQPDPVTEPSIGRNTINPSPFERYVIRQFSNGKSSDDQKYYKDRALGRGMNMHDIRNGDYWDPTEADVLFTWGRSNVPDPIERKDIELNNDIEHRDI
jgi:hypothetical protein